MSVTAPRITWHRTEAWSALVFDKAVTDEDRIAVAIDADKLFELGVVGPDKVRALVFERGEVAAEIALDVARTEQTLRELSIYLGGKRVSTDERWAFALSLGDIALRAWSAHLRMRQYPEVADTPLTPTVARPVSTTTSVSSTELTRTVH